MKAECTKVVKDPRIVAFREKYQIKLSFLASVYWELNLEMKMDEENSWHEFLRKFRKKPQTLGLDFGRGDDLFRTIRDSTNASSQDDAIRDINLQYSNSGKRKPSEGSEKYKDCPI